MDLWTKDNWSNSNIMYTFNRQIIEYDMKSAGLNLIREFQLLPPEIIGKLEAIKDKDVRNKKIGLLERTDKVLVENKKQAFVQARRQFIEQNKLERDDIIDIKKDAIFTLKSCPAQKFGNYIEFRPKNLYSSFMRVGKRKMELFYAGDRIDVKGISDELVPLHTDGMLKFFHTFFRMMETSERSSTMRFIRGTIDNYKKRDLPLAYYRQFNNKSSFLTNNGEEYMDYWEDSIDELNIDYNYFIITNLAKILI